MEIRAINHWGYRWLRLLFGGCTAVPNHQMQQLPASLMNSLQSKEDVELFQMHYMEETDIHHDLNYDQINVKVMCPNGFYQLSFLRFINNIIFFYFYMRMKVMMTLFVTWFLSSSLSYFHLHITFFHFFLRLKGLMTLFITKWDFILLLYLSTVFWLISTFTLCIVQESINDEVIADAILSLDVD